MIGRVPLIDLGPWRDGDVRDRAQVAVAVDGYLQEIGFLMVVDHGLSAAVTAAARAAANAFFDLPAATKQRYACPDGVYRGWVGPGRESNASSYGQAPAVDLKEAFSVGPVFPGADALRRTEPRWFARNIWPQSEVPDFRVAMEDWWWAARQLTDELLGLLAAALGMPADALLKSCERPMATITANRYPPVEANVSKGSYRVGPHTDFGTITVLDRDFDGGLQVEVEPDVWLDAPVVPGALTVNLGEMMVLLSGGRWRANPHRVVARPGAVGNLSLIYFHSPNHDMELPASPTGAATAGDYLGAKMDLITQVAERG